MTSVAQALTKIRTDYLLNGNSHRRNRLAAAINLTDTACQLNYDASSLKAGGHISIGLEEMEVWNANDSNVLTIARGTRGSIVGSHPSGSIVLINPRYSDSRLMRALADDIRGLAAEGLFRMATTELTFSSSTYGYGLPADLVQVYRASWEDRHFRDWHDLLGFDINHSADPLDFPTGVAMLLRSETPTPGAKVRVTYKARHTGLFAALTDDLGIPEELVDIVCMGAAIRLEVGAEVKRNAQDFQAGNRRAEEVPAGAQAQSTRNLTSLRRERVRAEREAFSRMYPPLSARR